MAIKRSVSTAPLWQPLMVGEQANTDWLTWFSLVAEQVFKRHKYSIIINPASVAANTTSEQTVAITGVDVGDMVIVEKPSHTTGLGIVNARVSAIDTVAITFMNTTGSPIDPPSETYKILVMKV